MQVSIASFLLLALLLAIMWLVADWLTPTRAQIQPVEVPAEYEARLIALDRQAIEMAYRRQVEALFSSWMKDPTGQPERASRGVNQARKAFIDSMAAVDKRERQ